MADLDLAEIQCEAGQTLVRELGAALKEARQRMMDVAVRLDHNTIAQGKWDLMRGGDAVTSILRRSGLELDPSEPDWGPC